MGKTRSSGGASATHHISKKQREEFMIHKKRDMKGLWGVNIKHFHQ